MSKDWSAHEQLSTLIANVNHVRRSEMRTEQAWFTSCLRWQISHLNIHLDSSSVIRAKFLFKANVNHARSYTVHPKVFFSTQGLGEMSTLDICLFELIWYMTICTWHNLNIIYNKCKIPFHQHTNHYHRRANNFEVRRCTANFVTERQWGGVFWNSPLRWVNAFVLGRLWNK